MKKVVQIKETYFRNILIDVAENEDAAEKVANLVLGGEICPLCEDRVADLAYEELGFYTTQHIDEVFASSKITDKEEALQVLSLDGSALERCSEELRDDIDVVNQALLDDPAYIEYASERIRSDPDVLLY